MILILSYLALLFGCESVAVLPDIGKIEGKVSISPLCGIVPDIVNNANPCGFNDEQLNQIYAKYTVAVFSESNTKLALKEVVLNKTGTFSFEVPVGTYRVEVITPDGSQIGQSLSNYLTKDVTILKNQTIQIEFNINTGIR